MKCIEMGENKFMQKKALLALLLVLTMILSGCSLIVKDEAVDAARVVIRVGPPCIPGTACLSTAPMRT